MNLRLRALLLAVMVLPGLPGAARDRKTARPESADSIEVIAHLALPPEPAVSLVTATHWRHAYLYIEHGSQGAVTTVDVTAPGAPKITAELAPPPGTTPQHVSEVEGTAVLFTGAAPAPRTPVPETVTIVSFDDPAHPKVIRQFSHVSCLLKEPARGLIYLVNDEGLWVLQTKPAPDREQLEEYDRYLRYNH